MKRFAVMGALMGALLFGATSTSQAYYLRPVPRVAARAVLPPYGPRVGVVPRIYPRAYYLGPGYGYGPRIYGGAYRGWGPGVGVGIGVY